MPSVEQTNPLYPVNPSSPSTHASNHLPEKAPSTVPGEPGLFTFFDSEDDDESRDTAIQEPAPAPVGYVRNSMVPKPLRSRTPSPDSKHLPRAENFSHPHINPKDSGYASVSTSQTLVDPAPLPSTAAIDAAEYRASLPFGTSFYEPQQKKIGGDFDAEADLNDDASGTIIPRKPLPAHTNVAVGIATHPRRAVDSVLDVDAHSISTVSSTALPASQRNVAPQPMQPAPTPRPFLHEDAPIPVEPERQQQSMPPAPDAMAVGGPQNLPLYHSQQACPVQPRRRGFLHKKWIIGLLALFAIFALIIFITRLVVDSKEASVYDSQPGWQ